MNPVAIVAIVFALVVGYFGLSGNQLGIFREIGRGPLDTGPGRGAEIKNPQPASRLPSGVDGQNGERPRPGDSSHRGKVKIISVDRSQALPEEEVITIRYGGGLFGFGGSSARDAPIDITGWRISSRRSSATLPRAYNIPEIDANEQDIVLPPGGEIIITTGAPSYPRSFRENQCIGYLSQSHQFKPGLSAACPDDNPEIDNLVSQGFNGDCIDAIRNVPACRTPQGPFEAAVIGSQCLEYMNKNLNYAGCVKNFRDRKDFLKSTWRVSLRQSSKLFDQRHDSIELRDRQGLLVDEFEY